MQLIVTFLIFAVAQVTAESQTIRKDQLPFSPLVSKQILVTDGLDLNLIPAEERNFDPEKEMPAVDSGSDGKLQITWGTTPSAYIVTDDQMLSVIEPRKDDSIFHQLEIIQYREKKPWKQITSLFILLFDHHIFCIGSTEFEDNALVSSSDANLRLMNGRLDLDVGQYLPGTGAMNSHAVFELSSKGPKLVGISTGGRGH